MEGADGLTSGKDERVFTYFVAEREVLAGLSEGSTILDLGCSDGPHLARLKAGGRAIGLDVSLAKLRTARTIAPVAAGVGERLPFAAGSFDLVYVSHVLHHAEDHRGVISEIHRVLRPGGLAFIVETCEDSPAMRLARTIRPSWDSDRVRSRFRFAELLSDLRRSGFVVERQEQFNVLYWAWAFARGRVPQLGRFLEQAVRTELAAVRRWRRFGAYGFVVARKSSGVGRGPGSGAPRPG